MKRVTRGQPYVDAGDVVGDGVQHVLVLGIATDEALLTRRDAVVGRAVDVVGGVAQRREARR